MSRSTSPPLVKHIVGWEMGDRTNDPKPLNLMAQLHAMLSLNMPPGVSSPTKSSTRKEPMDTSALDQHLAPADFCDRICLVRTNDDASVPVDCEVDAYRLWPALKFASHKELMGDIEANAPSNAVKKFKGLLTAEYFRLSRQRKERTGVDVKAFGIAYLIGIKGRCHLELLSKSEGGEIVTDNRRVFEFYDHIQEMEAGEGTHCGSEKFQSAVKLVMQRIEKTTAVMDGQSFASHSPARAKLEVTAAAKLTVMNMTESMHVAMTNTTTSKPPARGTLRKKSKNDRSSAESLDEAEHGRPVKTVEFSGEGCSGSVSSPEKPSFPDEDDERLELHSEASSNKHASNSVQKRIHRSSPAIDRCMSWTEMYCQMKADGWTHIQGSALVEWYYLHPTCKGMKKTDLLRDKEKGVDYFTSEGDLKRYAKQNLGWRAGCVSPVADSPTDAELADRIKKRKRGATLQSAKQAAANSSSEMTNNDAKSAKGVKKQQVCATKAKDMAPKMAPCSPKIQESVSSEEISRFSHVSDGEQTRSTIDSLTISELEVDLGVKSAKKNKSAIMSLKSVSQNACSSESCAESGSEARSNISMAASVYGIRSSPRRTSRSSPADSRSSSDQSSVDRTYQIMESISAWIQLKDYFGFSYCGSKYCLPGKENRPGKDSTALEGVNYFSSLVDLRKHLCAYGLPEMKTPLSKEARDDLALWVRFAHIDGLGEAPLINPDDIGDLLDFRKAWSMLLKLGLKYCNNCYLYPNSDPSMAPLRFAKAEDFSAHLARFGIPRVDGIQPNEVLSEHDRLRLDISIAHTDINTFARINPNGKNVYEITPRRPRTCRTSGTESTLVEPDVNKTSLTKNTLKRRPFQMEFNHLNQQRKLPIKLMCSEEALSTLIDYYNVKVITRDDVDQYCLPLAEGECSTQYFATLQDLRENLCAFGLPPMVKGLTMSDEKGLDLESWIRCANIEYLREPTATVPKDTIQRPKHLTKILKGLGYSTSSYVLPGTLSHKSKLGYDRFEKLIDLINHIARFGLDESCKPVSDKDRLELEVFVASVATFDVRKRSDECYAPIKKKYTREDHESSVTIDSFAAAQEAIKGDAVAKVGVTTVVKAKNTAQDEEPYHAAKVGVNATPSQPAVVDDEGDQDTPHPSPKKKPQANPITKFFSALSSTFHAPTDQRHEYSPALSLDNLSPSCIDTKGDHEIESCLAGTPDCEDTAPENAAPHPENGFATPKSHVKTTGHSSPQEISMDVTHHPQAESPNMPWIDLWAQMRKSGWEYCKGDDLVSFYWVHPSAAGMKKLEILRRCAEGIHYFKSEDAIHRYAVKRLGWAGEDVPPSPSLAMNLSMTARVKKRRLDNMQKSDVSSPPRKSEASPGGRNNEKVSTSTDAPSTKKTRSSPRNKKENGDASYSQSYSPGYSVSSQSIGNKEYKSPPDLQRNVRDKLECCQMVLHPSFNKKQLSKSSSMSVVSSMEQDIKDFMEKSILTGAIMDGMTLPSPGFLYVCGGPGTGKTTAVASCAEEMTKWAKKNGYEKPLICSVNMAASQGSSNSKSGIMRAMLKKIATGLNIASDDPLEKFEKLMMKRVVVLIVDEIDMLFKQHGGIGETWFKTLVSWCEDKELRFSMIGISNCVNDVDSTRVRELGHSPRELVFPTYKEDDIIAILEQRLGKHIVDHKALELISRRVAASSGDARRALEITSNAVGKCLDLLKAEDLDADVKYNDERMPLVKLPHMMRAIREAMPMRHADVISGLPQAAKVILCIAVSLGQVWGPTAKISIFTLKKYCVEATKHAIMDELGPGHVMSLVEMLIDSGLLVTDNSHHFNPNDANSKLKIGVQLDDVEIALEESLLNEGGFYRSLVDYVKRECPRPDTYY